MDLTKICSNTVDEQIGCVRILIRLLDNIVRQPNDTKYRIINLENKTIKLKLSGLDGIHALLHSIGYVREANNTALMTLSSGVMLGQIKQFVLELTDHLNLLLNPPSVALPAQPIAPTINNKPYAADKPYAQRIAFPSVLHTITHNPFLRQIERQSDHVMQYEDAQLQALGRGLMPLERLRMQATQRMRSLQTAIKHGAYASADPCYRDMLLAELVDWFRTSFFEWIDALACPQCDNRRPPSKGMRTAVAATSGEHTRVELSQCCGRTLEFHRYNDVAVLLRTRRGRCGEFANAFTFLCRCAGFEARLVVATFDHVWTEVYSVAQRRWVHVDPSDGVVDVPLMYQHGWKRQVDYVMAYSRFGVQDVTHRYCNEHGEAVSGRFEDCRT